jgi:hypothetical protein
MTNKAMDGKVLVGFVLWIFGLLIKPMLGIDELNGSVELVLRITIV